MGKAWRSSLLAVTAAALVFCGPAAAATRGDTLPVWSPDGTQIAFVHDGTQIWTAGADGSAAARVASVQDPPEQLEWTPVGVLVWKANFLLWRLDGVTPVRLGAGGDSFAGSGSPHPTAGPVRSVIRRSS